MSPADSATAPAESFGLRRNSRSHLNSILSEMIERPEAQAELAQQIDQDFGETRAVMVLDMSGFSRTTQRRGIVCFLLMIHQLKLLARPAIERAGGLVIKAEADNLFCLFEDVTDAVRAAREIMTRLETVNPLLPEDRRLHAAIGIGFGRILNVDEEDLFGDEVNLASKLGEDLAEAGQILLTGAANERCVAQGIETRSKEASISGLALNYFELA
jgi:class 3 adenylate cyclase